MVRNYLKKQPWRKIKERHATLTAAPPPRMYAHVHTTLLPETTQQYDNDSHVGLTRASSLLSPEANVTVLFRKKKTANQVVHHLLSIVLYNWPLKQSQRARLQQHAFPLSGLQTGHWTTEVLATRKEFGSHKATQVNTVLPGDDCERGGSRLEQRPAGSIIMFMKNDDPAKQSAPLTKRLTRNTWIKQLLSRYYNANLDKPNKCHSANCRL